jgi:hypothetical protein
MDKLIGMFHIMWMRDNPSFLQYADDTILFVEHDLEKVKKSEINFVVI